MPGFEKLPIVAVTAKALKDDRDRCIAAGASDYLPKPVDAERLIAMIATWTLSPRTDPPDA
jgi:CheY-like chemotaxis protein